MATTIKQIYQLALSQIFESQGNDEDYDMYSPIILNTLLEEARPYENQIRTVNNAIDGAEQKELLKDIPYITKIDDTVLDWDRHITNVALPYGLASVLLADDESRKAESVMRRNDFIQALIDATPVVCDMPQSDFWG